MSGAAYPARFATDGLSPWLSETESPAGYRRGEVETMKRNKNGRIISKLKMEMNVKGQMTYAEVAAYVKSISKHGLTGGQLNNILSQHFDRTEDNIVRSFNGSTNRGSVWQVRP